MAERAVALTLQANCQSPVATYATIADDRLRLTALVALPDGSRSLRDSLEGPAGDAEELGRQLAASLLDQSWHQLKPEEVPTPEQLLAFEAAALAGAGVALDTVPPRYRSTYFSHIIGGYSAGYYSYIWSEVLDADTVEWFKENGGMLRENGDHFRATLLSRGGAEDAMVLFENFRGRPPEIGPLLERRGLDQPGAE